MPAQPEDLSKLPLGPSSDPVQSAQMLILGQIRDGLTQVNVNLKEQGDLLRDTRERVIRVEEKPFADQISELRRRVHTLETEVDSKASLVAVASNTSSIRSLESKFARFGGIMVPITVVGTAGLGAILSSLLRATGH